MDIVTGTAGNTISSAIIVPLIQQLIQQMNDVIHLDENSRLLQEQLSRMKSFLDYINAGFRDQQRQVPVSLSNRLLRMQDAVEKGKELIQHSLRPWPQHCLDCLLCKRRVSTQIRKWKMTCSEFFDELQTDLSVMHNADQIVYAAPQQADVLLQDLPDTGLVGLKIKDAETQVVSWVTEASHGDLRTIGVYGMGGVGKTTLLKKVYNTVQVSHTFDHVIWATVAQFPIQRIQFDIASTINLNRANYSTETLKMKMSAYLKTHRFFLILDDLWTGLDLKELGVEFGLDKGSKLVFSTRNRELIGEMNAEKSLEIRQLPTDEAWDLFRLVAFKDGHVQVDIEQIAREVASECKGLPLAINIIASTMKSNIDINDWKFALNQMQKVDPNFPICHPRIEKDLYQRLRWSYNALRSAELKSCFLYCAMFEEDAQIPVEGLVRMWISEGLVKTNDGDYNYLLHTGHRYVRLLLDRCLLNGGLTDVYVHDVIRDMGIYIGEKEDNYVFRAGQRLRHFPDMEALADCKRLTVRNNNITTLPTQEFRCPKLVSLLLGGNRGLTRIPEDFFLSFTSLRVLDLQGLPLTSLPASLWRLIHLEFLDLSKSKIENISRGIGDLVHLQNLSLSNCVYLTSLLFGRENLRNLRYLDISDSQLNIQ